ncbi:hypothetical protein [Alteribacter aurantiacus]|uniref:hypothetical protein n=1 Tax=Alteribacter aurantiacus TaxID=254410 RepID=UPI0004130B20|nr:hypothetical protein [Alteribacter aurantiacus]
MERLIHYQWELFIATEVIAIVAIVAFTICRYLLKSNSGTKISLWLFILSNVFDVIVGFFIYRHTGELSTFQVVVFIFVVYAITFGRSDFLKLDYWLRTQIDRYFHTSHVSEDERQRMNEKKNSGRESLREWGLHVLLFTIVNVSFFLVFPSTQVALTEALQVDGLVRWFESPEAFGLFGEPALNQVVIIWVLILFIDTVVTMSYLLFPDEKTQAM